MIVLKFGGTSVGTPESLANVKNIVESLGEDAVVVVSALGGLTDRLIATARMAAGGDSSYAAEWEAMAARHENVVRAVIPGADRQEATMEAIRPLLRELRRLYDGISLIADLPGKTLAQIVSLGERMSSIIVTDMIPGAVHVDSLQVVKTEKWHNRDIAAVELTDRLIREKIPQAGGYPVIMGGFISTDRNTGEITNLGRGGSDYTAALVAAALDADVLQIWTDVDGFLTADPRVVKDARVVGRMSFVESMDLCTFGAKVIYPPTIYPVFHKNIPIRILNTHRPEAPGTFISDTREKRPYGRVAGISALKDEALVTLRGAMAGDATEISSRCFNALARQGLSVHLVARSSARDSFVFAIGRGDVAAAVRLLKEEFAPELVDNQLEVIEVIENLATLAVVGDDIRRIPGASEEIRRLLGESGIRVAAYSDKASETSLTFVIDEAGVGDAINLLHDAIYTLSVFGPQLTSD